MSADSVKQPLITPGVNAPPLSSYGSVQRESSLADGSQDVSDVESLHQIIELPIDAIAKQVSINRKVNEIAILLIEYDSSIFKRIKLSSKLIRELHSIDLGILILLIQKMVKENPEYINKRSQLLPLTKLKEALLATNPEYTYDNVLSIITQLAACKQIVPRLAPTSVSSSLKTGTLESLIVAFSFFSADHEPTGPWEAMQTLQIYGLVVLFPFFFAGVLDSVVHDRWQVHVLYYFAGIVGFMTTAFASMKIYLKISPIPQNLKPLRNYTLEALENRTEPLLGRDDIIEKVFLCWQSTNSSTRQHPLLVGPAGVGKTVIHLEIARRIAVGEMPNALKELMKDKKMFGGPAALFLPSNQMMETDDKLERFLRRIEPYKDKIILALDEIHVFMNEKYGTSYGELLKSMLDTSLRGLPYILGTTTDEEYRKYIACDPARARRFFVIFVPPLKKDHVKLALREMVRRQYPGITVTEDVLALIYETTRAKLPQEKQPEISKRILSLAISSISLDQYQSPALKKLQELRISLANLQSQYLNDFVSPNLMFSLNIRIQDLNKEIKRQESIVTEELNAMQKIKHLSSKLGESKEALTFLAAKIQSSSEKKAAFDELLIKQFIVIAYYLMPYLEAEKSKLQKEYALPSLDEGLINKLVDNYIASLQAAKDIPEEKEKKTSPDEPLTSSSTGPLGEQSNTSPNDLTGSPKEIKVGAQSYQPQNTTGHGACLLHAIMGQLKDGVVCWQGNDELARKKYSDDFEGKMSKQHDLLIPFLKLLIEDIPNGKEFQLNQAVWVRQPYYQAQLAPLHVKKKELIERNKVVATHLIEVLAKLCQRLALKDENIRLLFTAAGPLPDTEKMWKKRCHEIRGNIISHFKTSTQKYDELIDALSAVEKIEYELQKIEQQFLELAGQEALWKAYAEVIRSSDYWFTESDARIIAHLYNKKVDIYAQYNSGYEPACETLNKEAVESVIVFFHRTEGNRGYHYSQCQKSTE